MVVIWVWYSSVHNSLNYPKAVAFVKITREVVLFLFSAPFTGFWNSKVRFLKACRLCDNGTLKNYVLKEDTILILLFRWKSLGRLWTTPRQPCHSSSVEMRWSRAQWNPNPLTLCTRKQWSLSGQCYVLLLGTRGGGHVWVFWTQRKEGQLCNSYQELMFTSKIKGLPHPTQGKAASLTPNWLQEGGWGWLTHDMPTSPSLKVTDL